MLRTQVYLTEEIVRQIASIAKQQRKKVAQTIRELLVRGLREFSVEDDIESFAGKYSSESGDDSQKVDEILYGPKK